MRNLILLLSLSFLYFNSIGQCNEEFEQLVVINEIGSFVEKDGAHHVNAEYIELLVFGHKDNPTAKVDLTSYKIDDNNHVSLGVGNEPGHISFSSDFPKVDPGSIILIYNPEGNIVHPIYDGLPNDNGVYQLPITHESLRKCEGYPHNTEGQGEYDGCDNPDRGLNWDEFIPFRNAGDVAQIRDPYGRVIHSLAWWYDDAIPFPSTSIQFGDTKLKNKSIQLIGNSFNSSDYYLVSDGKTPGVANNEANSKLIDKIKGGLFSFEIKLEVSLKKSPEFQAQNGELELAIIGIPNDIEYSVFLNGNKYYSPVGQDVFSKAKLTLYNIAPGEISIEVEYGEENCKIETTFVVIEEIECETKICSGDCVTLNSDCADPDLVDSSPCIKWLDEDGNVIGSGSEIEICSEENQVISQHIENEDGIVQQIVFHSIVIEELDFDVSFKNADDCPPTQGELEVSGDNISTIMWSDGTTNSTLVINSSGNYAVTLTSPLGCISETSVYVSEEEFSNDQDGDGICDEEDCSPSDSSIGAGQACNDGNNCTKDDQYNEDCNCTGIPIPNCMPCQVGSTCDDNNHCTENDIIDQDCNCLGSFVEDCYNDCDEGSPCDDNNSCTTNDKIDSNCNCVGDKIDSCKECEIGSLCDDNNDCTENDIYYSGCECKGEFQDQVDLEFEQFGECNSYDYVLTASSNFSTYEWFLEEEPLDESGSQISVYNSGNYKVAASNGDGCFYTKDIFIPEIYTSTTVNISASAESICSESETIALSIAEGFTGIAWKDEFNNLIGSNTNSVNINAAGQYSVSVVDVFGCPRKGNISIASNIKNFEIEPKYPVICNLGDEIKLAVEDDFGNSYIWSTGETDHMISVFSPGTYSVTISSDDECSVIDQVEVLPEENVDLDKVLLENGFRKEKILITGIETLKGGNSNDTRNGECDINADQSKTYEIKRIEADPSGDVIDLEKYIISEVNRFRCFEPDALGYLVDNFCTDSDEGFTLSDFVANDEKSTFKYFILESPVNQESYIYFRSPTFVEIAVGGDDNAEFKSLLYDIVCHKKKGLDFTLSYDAREVNYGGEIDEAHFMTSGTIHLPAIETDKISYSHLLYVNYDIYVKLRGLLISNYQKGGKLLTSNPSDFIKSKVSSATITFHGYAHSVKINSEFYEIKIPYDPNTIDLELDPDSVDECEEGICESLDDQYYLSIYIPLKEYDSDEVNQTSFDKFNGFFNRTNDLVDEVLNNTDRPFSLEDLPLCIYDQEDVCQLFNVQYRVQEDALELVNKKLATSDFTYSSTIIDCFDEYNLVHEYAKMDNSFFKTEDTKLYRLLSTHFFNLQNPIDLEVTKSDKTTFLSETGLSIFDIEKNKNYQIKPSYDNFILKKGIANLDNLNYFDSDPSTIEKEAILLHPAKQFDYLNQVSSWPKKEGKMANIKVPGIYVAYVVNAHNDKIFDKAFNNALDIAGLYIGYTELKAIQQTKRFTTVNGLLNAAELPLSSVSLFLTNSDDYCYDGNLDYCKDLRAFHRTAQILLLTGNITNALIPNLAKVQTKFNALDVDDNIRKKILQNLDDIDTGTPKKLRSDYLNLMSLDLDILKKLKEKFENILITAQNDGIFVELVANLDKKDIYKLFDLENAIKNLDINNAESTLGLKLFEDLVATANINGKIGKELGKLTEGWVKAWKALYPSANRLDLDYLNFFERNTVLNSKNAIVSKNLPNQYPSLDVEDITAIHHYTDDFYQELNAALRSGSLDPHLTGFAKALNNGLDKLPNVNGTVYRGTTIPESVVMSKYKAAFDNGQTNIIEDAFTSTSTSPNVANSFTNDVLDPGEVNVFFTMTSSKGKDVDAFSRYGPNFNDSSYSESEVLFKSGESFSVKNFEDTFDANGDRIILITLED